MSPLTVEPVKDPRDKRRVVYWRWIRDGKQLGAVARNDDGTWRALIYRQDADGNRNTGLGNHDTRKLAEAAIRDWAQQNPEQTS